MFDVMLSQLAANTMLPRPKDNWDRAQIIGTILSAVIVALLGAFFTWRYSKSQNQTEERRRHEDRVRDEARKAEETQQVTRDLTVRRIDVLRYLLPELKSGNERDHRAALLAIRALGDLELAADLAKIYGGSAGVSALVAFASEIDDPRFAVYAERLLSSLLQRLRYSVVRLNVAGGAFATAFAVAPDHLITSAGVLCTGRCGTIQLTCGRPDALGREIPWELVKESKRHGLALIRVSGVPLVPLTIAAGLPVVDENVMLVGYNEGTKNLDFKPANVLEPEIASVDDIASVTVMEIRSWGGYSGGPIINTCLEVCGVHWRKYRETNDETLRGLAHEVSVVALQDFLKVEK